MICLLKQNNCKETLKTHDKAGKTNNKNIHHIKKEIIFQCIRHLMLGKFKKQKNKIKYVVVFFFLLLRKRKIAKKQIINSSKVVFVVVGYTDSIPPLKHTRVSGTFQHLYVILHRWLWWWGWTLFNPYIVVSQERKWRHLTEIEKNKNKINVFFFLLI